MLLPITTCTICGLGALSPSARCKTFDASADGYGRGEAFAVAVLGLPQDIMSSHADLGACQSLLPFSEGQLQSMAQQLSVLGILLSTKMAGLVA